MFSLYVSSSIIVFNTYVNICVMYISTVFFFAGKKAYHGGFLPGIFFGGGGGEGAKSIVMQISFVMKIFLLFSGQILGESKSL